MIKIMVSSEELRKTMEMMALLGAGGGKKKDDNDLNATNVVGITAVSPYKDGNYMLSFSRLGNGEQLTYRMEGKSVKHQDSAKLSVEFKRFSEMVKTLTGDVALTFEKAKLIVGVAGSEYNLTTVNTEILETTSPPGGAEIATDWLMQASRFCSMAVAKDAVGARRCIQIEFKAEGAICYAAKSSSAAKYSTSNTGGEIGENICLLPSQLEHIAELGDGESVRLVKDDKSILHAVAARFDYLAYPLEGKPFPAANLFEKTTYVRTFNVDRSRLIAALARASAVIGDDATSMDKVSLSTDKENFYVQVSSVAGEGTEIIPLDGIEGDTAEQTVAMSAKQMLRVIGGLMGDSVTIRNSTALAPVYLSAAGSNNTIILAPMRG